jgi:ribosomal protein L11 methylase PrmA
VKRVGGSFRDPSGFVFLDGTTVYRRINQAYAQDYAKLMSSGLYAELASSGLLVEHEELASTDIAPGAFKVIRPRKIRFISYPYEWTFGQLKAAALLTLEIQRRALDRGMSLKDASAYNIQFEGWRPVHLDTLSFETYREGNAWPAYRQFCEHFLAPLALTSYTGWPFHRFLSTHLDGLPLGLAAGLLPFRTLARPGLLTHIHLHALAQRRVTTSPQSGRGRMSRNALSGLISSLESAVKAQRWKAKETVWEDYYDNTNYQGDALENKGQLVQEFLDQIEPTPRLAWDLGANTGLFSRMLTRRNALVISLDFDAACVERNYQDCVREQNQLVLPLIMDLTNPTASLGWALEERASLLERGPADLLLALALIHHLAIARNIPLDRIARFFGDCARFVIVEFVPKEDSQVQRLLSGREDIFPDYSESSFIREFEKRFTIVKRAAIRNSGRTLFLMAKRSQSDGENE